MWAKRWLSFGRPSRSLSYYKKTTMQKSVAILIVLFATAMIGINVAQPSSATAITQNFGKPGKSQFNLRSLSGSYATAGRADGFQSRSIGVTEFDGRGGVTRSVRINTNDGEGGRILIDITAIGTYTVDREGICVMYLTNFLPSGNTTEVEYDMVIRKTSKLGGRGLLVADELESIQREPGVTASLIEESLTRRVGVR